ncbi:flavohemoprotein [Novimethylophilus kurashikiensis]|uniref:Flavohemoprotein n=1 Tax=Novimethylophilus kurashikiensis TaxID=1825523 RepID=A0A2R5FF81_9PROT|nr:acyl carrier protein [Novimethylophilus kurashikiensis]GBG15958.1 flavohemoprotein [Novimethylophilus kurashikiensis]
MTDSITQFVVGLIEKKAKLPKNIDLPSLNYIDSGYVDSIAIIKFVVEIEAKYEIEISETDIESPEFRTIGGLVSMINKKLGG